MWVFHDYTSNAVEMGTAHCIDWSGNDHVYWYGYYPPYGKTGWVFWTLATIGQAHRFSLQQDLNSQQWRWWVDSTQVFAQTLAVSYASGAFDLVGLESYNQYASVVYHDAWGLQYLANGLPYQWQQSISSVEDPVLVGRLNPPPDDWQTAENQSSGCYGRSVWTPFETIFVAAASC